MTRRTAGRSLPGTTAQRRGAIVALAAVVAWLSGAGVRPLRAQADDALGARDVLILVNAASPVSQTVAHLYRAYHPDITDEQIVLLSGLADCAAPTADPASEIITREDFETLIAQPVRDHLVLHNLVNDVYCIITTAGMPYRISDTSAAMATIVRPAGGDPNLTLYNRNTINAASVESELAVLFQIDSSIVNASAVLATANRAINPYQGYASPIKAWHNVRDILTRRETFRWTTIAMESKGPAIEGLPDMFPGRSARQRRMSPADLYLVARLDGPHALGESPVAAVERMLDRAADVSDPAHLGFLGYNAAESAIMLDFSPSPPALSNYAYGRTYNIPPQFDFVTHDDHLVPPGAEEFSPQWNEADHYARAYQRLVGAAPPAGAQTTAASAFGLGVQVVWDGTAAIADSTLLPPGTALLALATFGGNAGDGRPGTYLLTSGPGGGPLFSCVPGGVFTSIESFNAVTMFSGITTTPSYPQARIVDFPEIGGTVAVGHSFEPLADAIIQVDFLLPNLLRDGDGDGVADLTVVEAIFTAMPYLSWTEVVIGDPLTRLRVGPGGVVNPDPIRPDADADGDVDLVDFGIFLNCFNGPGRPYAQSDCVAMDFDIDFDVDLSDFGAWLTCFNGPSRPPPPTCDGG